MQSIIHWLENHMASCPSKFFWGIDCPGCGIQRSFIEFLKGNYLLSFNFYPALLPVIFTLSLTGVHLYFKLTNGAAFIKYSFIFTMIVIHLFYIVKLLR